MNKPENKNLQSRLDDLEIVLNQMVLIDRAADINELNTAIRILLASIGDYTGADRAYTFEYYKKTGIYRNSNEWCAGGVIPQIDNLQDLTIPDMPCWHKAFQKSESIIIEDLEDIRTEMPSEYEILKVQDIRTVIVFPMYHKNELYGFIGVDNPVLNQSQRLINLLAVVGGHLGAAYDSIYKDRALARKEQSVQKNRKIAEEANKANQAKTDFLSRMAHDIRTPMNAVMGFTSLAAQNTGDEEKVSRYLKKIQIAGRYLQQIVDDILDLTKIERGQFTLNPMTVDIQDLFYEVGETIDDLMPDKNLHYHSDIHDLSCKYVELDPFRMKQIYINLLSNAVKYTPEGGNIWFEVYEEEIPGSNRIRLVSIIRDDGIGMSEEYMKEMYQQFTRAVDTRVNSVRGSGLGLSIVKGIVDLMKGTIEADSSPGKGTRFCVQVEVPFQKEKPVSKKVTIKEDFSKEEKGLLLIAEDNDLNYEVASTLLESYGFHCQRAENGRICVERFRRSEVFTYRAILMDLEMPELNGLEATERIRAMEREDAETIPIIAITANAFKEDTEKCLKAGMTEYLSKPLDIKKLIDVLYEHRS